MLCRLPDPKKFLRDIHVLVKPGGVFVSCSGSGMVVFEVVAASYSIELSGSVIVVLLVVVESGALSSSSALVVLEVAAALCVGLCLCLRLCVIDIARETARERVCNAAADGGNKDEAGDVCVRVCAQVLISPYSWLPEYTKKSEWLGGFTGIPPRRYFQLVCSSSSRRRLRR